MSAHPPKLVLCVIDAMAPEQLVRAAESGAAPVLAELMRRGTYISDCVSAFPSVTPVCAASIATGVAQDEHLIPGMNWYSRAEERYVEYGSSLRAAQRFGIAQQLTDTIYNMNRAHLSPETPTVFETLDDAGVRTAGTTYLMYRGRHRHEPQRDTTLTRFATSTLARHPVMGPRELFYADLFASRSTGCRSTLGMPGVRDRHSGCVSAYLVEHDLFDFLLLSLPDNDWHSHRRGPDSQLTSLAAADLQLARVMEAAGGIDAFLDEHAFIAMADHSQALITDTIDLQGELGELGVLQPSGGSGILGVLARLGLRGWSRPGDGNGEEAGAEEAGNVENGGIADGEAGHAGAEGAGAAGGGGGDAGAAPGARDLGAGEDEPSAAHGRGSSERAARARDIEPRIAVCPSQRAAMVYALHPEERDAMRASVVARSRRIEGVDLIAWLARDAHDAPMEGVLSSPERGELRFAPGGDLHDTRGASWHVDGELSVLEAQVQAGNALAAPSYPDALARVWSALTCPTSGEVLLSASPGYEFVDWGGAAHVGGGSHGSLHASDSLAPLVLCGVDAPAGPPSDPSGPPSDPSSPSSGSGLPSGTGPQSDTDLPSGAGPHADTGLPGDRPRQWAIRDVASLVRRHFGPSPA